MIKSDFLIKILKSSFTEFRTKALRYTFFFSDIDTKTNKQDEEFLNVSCNSKKDDCKAVRRRIQTNRDQVRVLKAFYNERTPYPSKSDAQRLSDEINIGMHEVQIWFRNQRSADRRRAIRDDDCLTMVSIRPVSYTHLTLPTICSV